MKKHKMILAGCLAILLAVLACTSRRQFAVPRPNRTTRTAK